MAIAICIAACVSLVGWTHYGARKFGWHSPPPAWYGATYWGIFAFIIGGYVALWGGAP